MDTNTFVRSGPCGLIATRGNRELHILGSSVDQVERARRLLADRSFDAIFKSAQRAPHSKNVAYVKLAPRGER